MLTQLWREHFGQGVIDTNVDPASQSLAIGDLSGRVVVVDYFGNILFEQRTEMPVWGVAHCGLDNGLIATVTAEADKPSNKGTITLFHDDRLAHKINLDSPAWDVTFVEDGALVAVTDWAGTLRLIDPTNGSVVKETIASVPLFGLSGESLDSLQICGDRVGVLQYDYKANSLKEVIPVKSACYNVAVSRSEDLIAVGSHGPTISIFNRQGVEECTTNAHGIIAVKFFHGLLLFGGESGELVVRSRHDFDRDLSRFGLHSAIWNISIDPESATVFVALGDGSVAAFHIEASGRCIRVSEGFLQQRMSDTTTDLLEVLEAGVHPAFLTSAILEDIDAGRIGVDRALEIYGALTKNSPEETASELSLTLGVLALCAGKTEVAVSHLSGVDRLSPHYSLAVTLLARAHTATGRSDEATRILAKHLEQLDVDFQKRALSVICSPTDSQSELSHLDKFVTEINRTQSNKPVALTKMVNDDISVFLRGSAATSASESNVDYGIINYIKYEFASRGDHAKKILEMAVVDEVMGQWKRDTRGTPVSLDIGCATCRWPKYFSARGFLARDYDVDPEAVRICKSIAGTNDRIEIEQRNILECAPEDERYTLVTSMMGTFNHIPIERQHAFLDWIHASLKIGGILLFSSWSAGCQYTSYLQFYRSEERRAIRENSRSLDSLESLMKNVGLFPRAIIPFIFLPDECYEAWMEHVSEEAIVAVDVECRKRLPASQAQMVLCIAEKV